VTVVEIERFSLIRSSSDKAHHTGIKCNVADPDYAHTNGLIVKYDIVTD
jgi:hypothetical protein